MSSSPSEPGKVPTTHAAFPLKINSWIRNAAPLDGNAKSLEEELG